MNLAPEDITAIGLTLRLAFVTTVILLVIGAPLAYWLAYSRSKWRSLVNTLVALPLVLPPTVIGFYLLILMGKDGWLGQLTTAIGVQPLVFTFWGLVLGSVIYSLPFVVQPLQNAMIMQGRRPFEAALTLGASRLDAFFSVVLPLAKHGIITASVLGFAHTVGEFGVVLMIGGGIPGETKVASVQIYDHVESLDYAQAHALSGIMVVFSFCVLLALYAIQGKQILFGRSR